MIFMFGLDIWLTTIIYESHRAKEKVERDDVFSFSDRRWNSWSFV
jgi:hypothetical protein